MLVGLAEKQVKAFTHIVIDKAFDKILRINRRICEAFGRPKRSRLEKEKHIFLTMCAVVTTLRQYVKAFHSPVGSGLRYNGWKTYYNLFSE